MATNNDKDKEQSATIEPETQPDPGATAEQEAAAILAAAREEAEKIKAEAASSAAEAKKAAEEAKADLKAKKAEMDAKKEELDAKLAEMEAEKAALEAAAAAAAQEQPVKEEETVPIRLFKDNDKYKDDVFVAVNGRRYLIKRGETVMVPRSIAEVLERSMAQDEATANLIQRQSGEYQAEAARLGL